MMRKLRWLCFVLPVLLASNNNALAQGATTAGMNGRITDQDGQPLPGATVIAEHKPTSSQFGNITDETGAFRLANMNVGGPYEVTVTFVGYQPFVRGGIFLNLGQTYRLEAQLTDDIQELEELEIVAKRGEVFDGNRTAPETNLGEYEIEQLPTVSRSLNDFTRLSPLANTSVGINGAISFGGLNNRYNSIFIDGAANNDLFGLANSGTNGGQTGISPISIDAIEQFQIVLAPYDVRLGGLAGAGINAVTRSGSNEFEGSVYYLVSNEDFAGDTPTDDPDVPQTKLADFSNKTYGLRIGGPIVKDKLFFFFNAEIQRDETPQPFDIQTYDGSLQAPAFLNTTDGAFSNAQEAFDAITNKLQTDYGYEPGSFTNTVNSLEGEKFLGRIDWNLSREHKITLRHSYTKADQFGPPRATSRSIFSANSGQTFPSTTNSSALEVKSTFGNSISNSFILGLTFVRDDREVTGQPFPSILINDGDADIQTGAEPFSHANIVNQDVITITNNLNIYKGKHTITLGTHNEFFSIFNVFLPFHPPQYSFANLDKFLVGNNGTPEAFLFLYGHEQSDENIGDNAVSVAADFSTVQLGFYAQDEYQVNNDLKLTAGLRVDIPIFNDDAPSNPDFDNNTIPLIEAEGYDLEGARAGQAPSAQAHFSPRFGFNYDISGNKTTQIRGGVGIFTSRIPYVWPGGIYLRNGLTSGFTVLFDGAGFGPPGVGGIEFEPDLTQQPAITGGPQGDVDLFAEDFKFPQIFKSSLGIDQQLPWWGLISTFEFQYTTKINDVLYEMVNKPRLPIGNLAGGPDNRPIFDPTLLDPTYNNITLATNTDEGYTVSLTAQLQKAFDNGFTGNLSYAYTKAESLFDGTVFINSSQWQEYHSINGRNFADNLQNSQFNTGSRISGYVSYRKEYLNNFASSITLFYNGQSGIPFSYVYNDNDGQLNNDDPNLDEPRNLIYIPARPEDINLVDQVDENGNVIASAQEQWQALDAFIEGDDYLSENRGEFAERNAARMPFTNILDLRFAQEFFLNTGDMRHTLEVSIDIFNFTNLLNDDWGRVYQISDNQNFQLIRFTGFQDTDGDGDSGVADGETTPTFTFTDPGDPWDIVQSGVNSARWNARFQIRYSF